MIRRSSIVVFAVAALFAAAPSLALAAQICGACCCSPCDDGGPTGCGEAVVGVPCCDDALPALPAAAKRTLDGPALQELPPLRTAAVAGRGALAHRLHPAPLAGLVSPLRLSVVLRI